MNCPAWCSGEHASPNAHGADLIDNVGRLARHGAGPVVLVVDLPGGAPLRLTLPADPGPALDALILAASSAQVRLGALRPARGAR